MPRHRVVVWEQVAEISSLLSLCGSLGLSLGHQLDTSELTNYKKWYCVRMASYVLCDIHTCACAYTCGHMEAPGQFWVAFFFNLKYICGAEEMAKWLHKLDALVKNQSSLPSTQVGQLTIA